MADGAAEACICVLFYGADEKHFKLAQRVLNEPMRCLAGRNIEFRFGCNAVGDATTDFLRQQISDHFHDAVLFHSPQNIMKYPMMREMFHAPRIRAPVTIWFDHDSCIVPEADANRWLDRVMQQLTHCDMLGSVQRAKIDDEHVDWIARQTWYTGKNINPYVSYAIGSWWAIKTPLLAQFDWPADMFKQKTGDVVLGELLRQNDLCVCHFRDDVRINVNDAGVEAATPRTIA